MSTFEPINIFERSTLSVRAIPGQDKLYQNTNYQSIFTFGDFRLTRDLDTNIVNTEQRILSFDRAQNLTSLTSSDFNASRIIYLTENDLNLDLTDPNSYSYFGSYYSKVATSINNIINNFPYAILAYDGNVGQTNFLTLSSTQLSYTEITLISSAFTNQGNIIFASGNSLSSFSSNTLTLFDNFNKFELQLSSSTLNTSPSFPILSYSYSAISNFYHLNFKVSGIFTANTTDAIYIRPSKKRYFEYIRSLNNLEYQLLEVGKFSVPNPNNDRFFDKIFTWPKTIDGFGPDSYGTNFNNYTDEILRYASLTDQLKTNWLVRAIVPETYLELDTEDQIYNKLIRTYGDEFDKIKNYIDNLAFSHSINYTESETISNKFIGRLSELLGWRQPINFTDVDFFEFMGQVDNNNKTLEDYNLDLWRRFLTNINWLYKRKGTREPISFIFKIIGAPDCLVNFNEFVYKIQRNLDISVQNVPFNTIDNSQIFVENSVGKINENGYINYSDSYLAFQEGGLGRGNGQDYINYWRPEFDPIKTVDNIKIQTGDPTYFGSENIVNTKEVVIALDPAAAIECDVFDWYKLGFFYSGNSTVNLPSDYKISDEELVAPPYISAMTISDWLNFVYSNNVGINNRKVSIQPRHNFFYPNLRKIYLTYYFWNVSGEISNMITFRKLEKFLNLIENKIGVYIEQLIPATTIFDGVSTLYRNTVFNRQKFVYPLGINDDAEYQVKLPPNLYSQLNGAVVTSSLPKIFAPVVNAFSVNSNINNFFNLQLNNVQTSINVGIPLNLNVNAASVNANIFSSFTQNTQVVGLNATVIPFPLSGMVFGSPPQTPQPYTGNTSSGGQLGPVPFIPSYTE